MTTSNSPTMSIDLTPRLPVDSGRGPLRLEMSGPPVRGPLDGAWWPRSRDLRVELADLVDHFPASAGKIDRAVISGPAWLPAPRRVPVARGFVKVGCFPHDGTQSNGELRDEH